ncbi:MAG: KH domain-containing protein, partial [bacterium]|nr:KH domain-containing protein [bacterium]
MADVTQTITQTADKFLQQLGIEAEVTVDFQKDEQLYQVNLKCTDPGVLIGHHGETLSAMQLILGQHLKAQTGEWLNLSVNVNDYRQRREQTLFLLADNTVEQVLATGQAHSLPPMPANERRIIHLHLA